MIKKKIPLPLLSAVLLCLAVLVSCAGTGTDAPMYTDGTETKDEGSCTLPDDFRIRDTEPLPETMPPETAAPAAEPITEPITEPVTEALPEPLTFETVTEDSLSARAVLLQEICGFLVPQNDRSAALDAIRGYLKASGLADWTEAIRVNEKSIQSKMSENPN